VAFSEIAICRIYTSYWSYNTSKNESYELLKINAVGKPHIFNQQRI